MKKTEKTNKRVYKKRRLITVAAIVGLAGTIAVCSYACNRSRNRVNTEEILDTTETMETTISTGDTLAPIITNEEETEPIYSQEYDISVNTNGTLPTYQNGGSYNGGSTTGTVTQLPDGTYVIVNGNTVTPAPFIPDIEGMDGNTVTITYDESGRPQEIVWETVETTVIAPIVDTDPHGSDPLNVEPTNIVNPDPTNTDRPPVITVTPTPAPVVTPAVPTGDVPGEQPTVYPTEPSQTVPTPAPTTEPTFPPEPTETVPTLPPLDDDHIVGDDNDIIVYSGMAAGRSLVYKMR